MIVDDFASIAQDHNRLFGTVSTIDEFEAELEAQLLNVCNYDYTDDDLRALLAA